MYNNLVQVQTTLHDLGNTYTVTIRAAGVLNYIAQLCKMLAPVGTTHSIQFPKYVTLDCKGN